MPTREDLRYFQALPLDLKVAMTKARIREAVQRYGKDGCYISFSGGKDSTVLLDIVMYYARKGMKWAIKKVNGELRQANGELSIFNCEKYKPLLKVDFLISDRCCSIMKKSPLNKIDKFSIIATMAEESNLKDL